MRRENGTGTIYKVKDRKLRKPYKVIVITGYDLDTGNPKRKVLGYYAKASEANEALANYVKNKDTYDLKKLTVKEVFDRWWNEHKEKVKPNTIKVYNTAYNAYLSKLNEKVFSELKTLELQDFFNNIESRGRQHHVKVLLKSLYLYALKYEIVDKNYAELIELKKKEKVLIRKIFTSEEITKLFEMKDNKIAQATIVLIYTGLRIDEFLSLKKEDVENNFIYVRDSKTNAGIRVIPIHQKIKNIIDNFLNEESIYLFTWKNKNKKMLYETFRRNFEVLTSMIGEKHTVHDTRHTFASMLNKVGANDVVISNLAGHEDKEFTKKVYTHTDLEELEETIKLLQ